MTIAFNIVTAWTGFDCAGLNYVIYLAIPYLTLIIANYLAACIKILSLQLEQLIASKNQVLEAQGQEFPDAYERITRLNRGKRRVNFIFSITIVVLLIIFIIDYLLS